MTTENRKAPRPPGMFTGKPSIKQAFKTLAKAPFKFLGGATEKVIAPIALAPYQLATDKVVEDKIKDHASPFKFSHDLELENTTVPTDHKLDFTGSSVDRGFSFERGGFTTDYNVKLAHEIRLGKPRRNPVYEVDPEPEFEYRSAPPAQEAPTAYTPGRRHYPEAFTDTNTRFPLKKGGKMPGERVDRDMAGGGDHPYWEARAAEWERTHHKPAPPQIAYRGY
jgi:hypothetical protein